MSELSQVLRHLIPVEDPRALVDSSTGDDAAVYLLADDRALVVTLDFFGPVVDDARDFGRIAAANSLSDVFAMGATPIFALNLFAFPREHLGEGVAEEIIAGGAEVARDAGVPILGGHSIDDPEPKYGMVAIGEVHPDRLVTNAAGRPGDVLILTKPLGIGVITTAIKRGAADEQTTARAVAQMAALNAEAARIARSYEVRAGTDVTGFGLLGHLRSLCRASGVSAHLVASDIPVLEGAAALAEAGHVPGGTHRNLEDVGADTSFAEGVDPTTRILLADAQTSGGLLLCVNPDRAESLLGDLVSAGLGAAAIGHLVDGNPGALVVGA
jgi:selenide,water dikinase